LDVDCNVPKKIATLSPGDVMQSFKKYSFISLIIPLGIYYNSAECFWNPFKKKKKKPKTSQVNVPCNIKIAIANMKRQDGFGANVQQIIGAALYAELHKYPFYYQPFETMEHNYNGQPNDPDYLAKHETLINCIGNFPTVDQAHEQKYVVQSDHYAAFLDANIDKCAQSLIVKKIKSVFRANKNTPHYFNPNRLNIAVHIRRHNAHDSRTYGTDVPNKTYIEIIAKLRAIYSRKHPLFHIYSQGEIRDFIEFEAEDTLLHINDPAEETYTALVLADALVAGRSSFSYTAGYLSDGFVYYISYFHKPLPHWISAEKLIGKNAGGIDVLD
jgi:hypothetical protein